MMLIGRDNMLILLLCFILLKYWLKIKSTTDTLLKYAYLKETQMIDNNIGTLRINTWTIRSKEYA